MERIEVIVCFSAWPRVGIFIFRALQHTGRKSQIPFFIDGKWRVRCTPTLLLFALSTVPCTHAFTAAGFSEIKVYNIPTLFIHEWQKKNIYIYISMHVFVLYEWLNEIIDWWDPFCSSSFNFIYYLRSVFRFSFCCGYFHISLRFRWGRIPL